jgi:hypothetical protein
MLYLKSLPPFGRAFLFAAFALHLLPLSGCQESPSKGGEATAPAAAVEKPQPPAPEANIFVDEPMLAKPYAIIGGSVENVGTQRLESLSVVIELRSRSDGSVERREVALAPLDLEPGKLGKFSLKVLSEEWGSSRVVMLRSAARPQEVAFKSLPGAKRPPERVKGNVVIVKTPTRKSPADGEFINTPDTPFKVP